MLKPTEEQDIIVSRAIAGHPLLVEALAGTGKTSSQVMIANAMPRRRGSYITFNRSIADDAATKFTGGNVISSTVHSRAFQAVGKNFAHRLEGPQGGSLTPLRILQHFRYTSVGGIPPMSRAGLAKRTLTNFLSTMADEPGPEHVPSQDMIQLTGMRSLEKADVEAMKQLFADDARELWKEIHHPSTQAAQLPMPHDGYLHLYAKSNPRLPGDFILLDEAQDASEAIKHIVLSQDAQQIIVGDQRQSIYGWRGAINLMEELDWDKDYLTQSFRFGDRIASAANCVLDHLDCPVRMTGYETDRSQQPLTRAMMFRTNSGVFSELIERTLEKDQRIYVAGGVSDLYQMLNAVEALKRGKATAHPDFIGFSSWPEYVEASEAYNAPHEMRLLVKIVKKYPMERLKAAITTAKDIEEHFSDITLLTAHKGKGREWTQIALGKDFNLPGLNPLIDHEDNTISEEEARLHYVTLTRAQQNIYGANEMIGAYRERSKIKAEIAATEGEPVNVRLAAKMKYAPGSDNMTLWEAFCENLKADEWAHLEGRIEKGLADKDPRKTDISAAPDESSKVSSPSPAP